MLFSKKWLRNHPKFLLHFLIHIDVLMVPLTLINSSSRCGNISLMYNTLSLIEGPFPLLSLLAAGGTAATGCTSETVSANMYCN